MQIYVYINVIKIRRNFDVGLGMVWKKADYTTAQLWEWPACPVHSTSGT